MSYRIAWYRTPKETEIKYGEYNSTDIYDTIMFDCGTNLFCKLNSTDEKFRGYLTEIYNDIDVEQHIISKDGFKYFIEKAIEQTTNYIGKIVGEVEVPECDRSLYFTCEEYMKHMWREMAAGFIYDLDCSDKANLTNSWSFEFGIFNFIYTLKTFDWDNNFMIICGG